jgi:ankyrin repeat protein
MFTLLTKFLPLNFNSTWDAKQPLKVMPGLAIEIPQDLNFEVTGMRYTQEIPWFNDHEILDEPPQSNLSLAELDQLFETLIELTLNLAPQAKAELLTHHPTLVNLQNQLNHAIHHQQTNTLINLLSSGNLEVNFKGKFEWTPLHLAVLIDNVAATKILLAHGADLNAKAYKIAPYWAGFSPLALAIKKGNVQQVDILIQYGALKNSDFNEVCAMIENVLLDIESRIAKDPHAVKDITMLTQQLQILWLLAQEHGSIFDTTVDALPLDIVLTLFKNQLSHPPLRENFEQIIEKISALDNHAQQYIQLKSLLHALELQGHYPINYPLKDGTYVQVDVDAEGFFNDCTVPKVKSEIDNYIHHLTEHGEQCAELMLDEIEPKQLIDTLQQVSHIFDEANQYINQMPLNDAAELAFARFNANQTILLPSGWLGHSVSIIFNKPQQWLMVANNGMRHDELDSGVQCYKIGNLQKVDAALINKILDNSNTQDELASFNLEADLLHSLEVDFTGNSILEPEQMVGNCSWQSQESALVGLLYIEFKQLNLSNKAALAQAETLYEKWDAFQTQRQVSEYVNSHSLDESEALVQACYNQNQNASAICKKVGEYFDIAFQSLPANTLAVTDPLAEPIAINDVLGDGQVDPQLPPAHDSEPVNTFYHDIVSQIFSYFPETDLFS